MRKKRNTFLFQEDKEPGHSYIQNNVIPEFNSMKSSVLGTWDSLMMDSWWNIIGLTKSV